MGTYVAPTAGPATIASLGAERITRQTHLHAFGVLRGILDDAVSANLIKPTPAQGVKNLPRKTKGEHTYLDHVSVQRLADAADAQWRLLVYLACYTVMRWGEIAALRASDLDFRKRRVKIVRDAVVSGNKFHVGTPKSGKTRTAPLPGFLADELKEFCSEKSLSSLVFEAPRHGGFILRPKPKGRSEGETDGSWWAFAKEGSGVPAQMRLHDMRHTAANLAVQSCAHVKVLHQMLGHASAATTLDG